MNEFINIFYLGLGLITFYMLNYPIMYPKKHKISSRKISKYPLDIVQVGAAIIIQRAYRKYISNILVIKYKNQLQDIINEDAAVTIQRIYKGYSYRNKNM